MKRGGLLMAALLAQLQAGAADQVTGEDLVYTEAWGTQSACSYCSYVKGQVIEKPQEEVRSPARRRARASAAAPARLCVGPTWWSRRIGSCDLFGWPGMLWFRAYRSRRVST